MTNQKASKQCQKNHWTVQKEGEKKAQQYVIRAKKGQELARADKLGKAVELVLNFRGNSKSNKKTGDGRSWFA